MLPDRQQSNPAPDVARRCRRPLIRRAQPFTTGEPSGEAEVAAQARREGLPFSPHRLTSLGYFPHSLWPDHADHRKLNHTTGGPTRHTTCRTVRFCAQPLNLGAPRRGLWADHDARLPLQVPVSPPAAFPSQNPTHSFERKQHFYPSLAAWWCPSHHLQTSPLHNLREAYLISALPSPTAAKLGTSTSHSLISATQR
ncbi:hypothetical protein VTI74DRAFT_3170 [Chaetomium olivicolor]